MQASRFSSVEFVSCLFLVWVVLKLRLRAHRRTCMHQAIMLRNFKAAAGA